MLCRAVCTQVAIELDDSAPIKAADRLTHSAGT
jgi:hypothetical protein